MILKHSHFEKLLTLLKLIYIFKKKYQYLVKLDLKTFSFSATAVALSTESNSMFVQTAPRLLALNFSFIG